MRGRSALTWALLALVLAGCRSATGPAAPVAPEPHAEAGPPEHGSVVSEGPTRGGEAKAMDPVEVAEPVDDTAAMAEEPEVTGPDELQQEALDLCQSAREFLDRGDSDDAVAALDHAYELMLALPNDGDTTYLQAKEDIRRVVADLLARTYSVKRDAAGGVGAEWDLGLKVADNERVEREVASLTGGERDEFLAGLQRSGRYRPMILAKLAAAGMPSQLSWLPLVESWFKVRALSRASALGMWQFIASTGLRFGLERDGWIDERMDPEKSTDAAIAYLAELHAMFGDWPKVLAAYNCGEARVMRLSERDQAAYQDFWDLYSLLPQETRRYVPRFFAALKILDNPGAYGLVLPSQLETPVETKGVAVSRPVQLSRLDALLGLEQGTLQLLNPELRRGATPDAAYTLKVPATAAPVLEAQLDQVPEWRPPQPLYVTHRVRRGETLSQIAARYGSSVRSIMQANRIGSANRIWPGQRLQVPTRRSSGTRASVAPVPSSGRHVVRRGESLFSIARRYGTSVAALRRENNLSSSTIYPGQTLLIPE